MTFGSLIWFAVVLICPISMMFMMRGMGGGMSKGMHGGGEPKDMRAMHGGEDAKDLRLAGLEREVAELRAAQNEQRFVELHKPVTR